ncbi:SpoIIE family protein phosphatase [Urbifossiella limnaea]|uniref:Phosphoserine phosphatase RsbU n=1 Tax=Urbifossiella limnaea TaxID=2528023 RepID=A0A517XR53_9BACT|nr:SpoIIE family protein phosphatase [Urbifossiella limnaea]QDU19997.1 Phosphoserine phosphatase RsbU [Urbifossiella limnaea]
MPTLVLLNGPRAGHRFPILGERFSLGRLAGCDVVIDDTIHGPRTRGAAPVSRQHALITAVGADWFIEDGDGNGRKSRNGTNLNGRKLPFPGRHPLADRDQIWVCDLRFEFRIDPDSSLNIEAAVSMADSAQSKTVLPADRLRAILDFGAGLHGVLDPDALLARFLDHLFVLFPRAERGFVVLRDGPAGAPAVRAMRTAPGAPHEPAFSTTVIRKCLAAGEALLGSDLVGEFPESGSIGALGVRSLVCAPLWDPGGDPVGVVQLDSRAAPGRFTADDLHLLLGVAGQVSVGLSNCRLHRDLLMAQRRARDLDVARDVQRALLPRALPVVPGYEFYAHYEPAQQVGGDYYDFIPLPGGRLAVLLGDVSGKGVSAALVMAKFGVEARVCLETAPDLAAAVTRLNALMTRAAVADKFVTLVVLVVDPATGAVVVANAGHPSPLIRRQPAGAIEDAVSEDVAGMPVGFDEGHVYGSGEFRLEPGDAVFLFSDGVTDAADPSDNLFGADGVRAVLAAAAGGAAAVGATLVAAVRNHAADADQRDDIALVAIGRLP